MEKSRDGKNVMIVALVAIILFMSVGYAAFASVLVINGSSTATGSWDVRFISLSKDLSLGASEVTNSAYDVTTLQFSVELNAPGDTAEYTATIKNNGTIDAKLTSIIAPNLGGTDAIIYSLSGINENDVLASGDEIVVVIKAEYNASLTETPPETVTKNLTVTLNFQQN